MKDYRKVLAAIGGIVLIAAVALGARSLILSAPETAASQPSRGLPTIGGPFTLTDQNGRTVTDADFHGRYMLIYFGYTYCPDVCPTSLQVMADALDLLGPKADEITPVLITIDPQRDTSELLRDYVANFHPRMVGLTGTQEQIAAAAKAYRVYFAKAEQDGGVYLMDHSSIVYLMGKDGSFLGHFGHNTPADKMAEGIRKHL